MPAAQVFERSPIRDADDPSRYARVAAELLDVRPNDEQSVVDDLVDQVLPVDETLEEARQTPVVKQVEIFQRRTVAQRDHAQQLALAFFGAAQRRLGGRVPGPWQVHDALHDALLPRSLRRYIPASRLPVQCAAPNLQTTEADTRPEARSRPNSRCAASSATMYVRCRLMLR